MVFPFLPGIFNKTCAHESPTEKYGPAVGEDVAKGACELAWCQVAASACVSLVSGEVASVRSTICLQVMVSL